MRKSIYFIGVALLAATALSSCDKDTEGVTGVTYYATLQLEGPDRMLITAGQPFEDPGYVAELNGENVTEDVRVSTDLNTDVPGLYTVNYSISNADGFSSYASRTVLVVDAGDPVSGFYTVSSDSYRDYAGVTYYGGYPLTVIGNGAGEYEIDDLLGGWYAYRAGYGSSYAMYGELTMGADDKLTLDYSLVPGWADSAASFEGSYDAASGTLSWVVEYTDYPFFFHVFATKD